MNDGMHEDDDYLGIQSVELRHLIDEHAVYRWMVENVEEFRGPLQIFQFKGGQSNPTYRLDTPSHSYVLRRKPSGPLLPSAHAIDREFRVIEALGRQGFPVARVYALCVDEKVLGTAFYVMSYEDGRIFWNPTLPNVTRNDRRQIFKSKIETLAKLHEFEPERIGLGDFGRPGNYFSRQVARWSKQYIASSFETIPEMDRLMEWLPQTIPSQERVSIVHGDYRIDNMVFRKNEPQVQAVLDWELSTLGDPMADFTYLLMQWTMPKLMRPDLVELGIPSMDEAVQIYCRAAGRSQMPDLDWYLAYNLFRSAAICQGIAARIRDGTASNEKAEAAARNRFTFAQAASDYANKAMVT